MMRYLLVDQDGDLHELHARDYRSALAQVGPEGWARVRLHPAGVLAGFVNDCGLLFPDRYRRNVVGSCLLVSLGASPMPYAGPVVLTNWDDNPWGDDVEVQSIDDDQQVKNLQTMHHDIRCLLGLEGLDEPLSDLAKPNWQNAMRKFVAWLADAPTPQMEIVTGEAALAEVLRSLR